MKNIAVSDVTLSAICEQDLSLTFRERLSVAESLDASHFDAIELPALTNSKENEVIYRTIASSIKNSIVKIDKNQAIKRLVSQLLLPENTNQAANFFDLLEKFIDSLDFYVLTCNTNISSVEICYNGMNTL
jgi:hypothetical protein